MLDFLYFTVKCAVGVLLGKFFFDTIQVFIKCKFGCNEMEDEE